MGPGLSGRLATLARDCSAERAAWEQAVAERAAAQTALSTFVTDTYEPAAAARTAAGGTKQAALEALAAAQQSYAEAQAAYDTEPSPENQSALATTGAAVADARAAVATARQAYRDAGSVLATATGTRSTMRADVVSAKAAVVSARQARAACHHPTGPSIASIYTSGFGGSGPFITFWNLQLVNLEQGAGYTVSWDGQCGELGPDCGVSATGSANGTASPSFGRQGCPSPGTFVLYSAAGVELDRVTATPAGC